MDNLQTSYADRLIVEPSGRVRLIVSKEDSDAIHSLLLASRINHVLRQAGDATMDIEFGRGVSEDRVRRALLRSLWRMAPAAYEQP